jgi:glycosyltransferase involved in cell wall biosynthesis
MRYALGFVMEQTLGQVTHDQNFRNWVVHDPDVAPTWMPIPFDAPDRWSRLPWVRSNWTLRASLRARHQVRAALRSDRFDGLFFHTPVTALFAQRLMAKVPTVVSMDATPLNLDSMGASYGHVPSASRHIEALKNALTRRTFECARTLIVWSEWARQSLIRDYQVEPTKIQVIPPGIDLQRWSFRRDRGDDGRPLRLLFVGGDFRRKGGEVLLTAFRRDLMDRCELDIVTRDDIDVSDLRGVRVHRGLNSNAPGLLALFAEADVFVFPTLGDCLPIVIMEAMAAGLPVVATNVGAIREEVEHGVTGLLTAANDAVGLADAVLQLLADSQKRRQMGLAGRRAAERLFDAEVNYRRVLATCKACIDEA